MMNSSYDLNGRPYRNNYDSPENRNMQSQAYPYDRPPPPYREDEAQRRN